MPDKLQTFTVPEVARLLRVRNAYVYELIYRNKLKAIKLSERGFRITRTALEEFLEKEEGLTL